MKLSPQMVQVLKSTEARHVKADVSYAGYVWGLNWSGFAPLERRGLVEFRDGAYHLTERGAQVAASIKGRMVGGRFEAE
jgi:hypothetical protein